MSERTDMKDKIPEYKLENKSLVYHSKGWLNHLAETVRYLLNKSITSKNSTIEINTNWNQLEPNTISQVDSWKGPNAPELDGIGIVGTLSNVNGNQNYQFALSKNVFASRLVGQPWSYTDGSDHNLLIKLKAKIQDISDQDQQVENSFESDTNQIFSYMDSNSATASKATSNLAGSTFTDKSELNYQISNAEDQINALGDNKENKTSEASDVNNINKALATKENIIDGTIPNPDLNQDFKVGNFIINKPTVLRNGPHTTYEHHDVGLLQVKNLGDHDLIQVLYTALGNPNNQSGDNQLDGNGAISYRSMFYYPKQNYNWQPWHTIPYQSDFDSFKDQTASNFNNTNSNVNSYVTSLNNEILDDSNKATGYTNSVADNLRNYTDSETSIVNSVANDYYNNANNKETSDFDQVTNQMNSMTSSARSETAVKASIEAGNLINSLNSATGNEEGQLQGAIINIENFESIVRKNNNDTQGQINSLGTNVNKDYTILNNNTNDLKKQVPNDINNAINKNNTSLQSQWNTSIGSAANSINTNISSSFASSATKINSNINQASNNNHQYTSSEVGSLDTRLYNWNQDLSAPISEANQLTKEMSGIDLNKINDIDNLVKDQINPSSFATVSEQASNATDWDSNSGTSLINKVNSLSDYNLPNTSIEASSNTKWINTSGSSLINQISSINTDNLNSIGTISNKVSNNNSWINSNGNSLLSAVGSVASGTDLQDEVNSVNNNLQQLQKSNHAMPYFSDYIDTPYGSNYHTVDLNLLTCLPDGGRGVSPSLPTGIYDNSTGKITFTNMPDSLAGVSNNHFLILIRGNSTNDSAILIDTVTGNIYTHSNNSYNNDGWVKSKGSTNNNSISPTSLASTLSSYAEISSLSNYVKSGSLSNYATNSSLSQYVQSAKSSLLPYYDATPSGLGLLNKIDVQQPGWIESGSTNGYTDLTAGVYDNSSNLFSFANLPSVMTQNSDPKLNVSTNDGILLIHGDGQSVLIDTTKGLIYTYNIGSNWARVGNTVSNITPSPSTNNIDINSLANSITTNVESSLSSSIQNNTIPSLANSIGSSVSASISDNDELNGIINSATTLNSKIKNDINKKN